MHNRLAVAAITLALAAQAADGQGLAARHRTLDSLARVAAAATARLKAHDDSVRMTIARLDSVVVGPVALRVQPGLSTVARAGTQIALDSLRPTMGRTLERVSRHPIVIRLESVDRDDDTTLAISPAEPTGIYGYRVFATAETIAGALLRTLPYLAMWDASHELVRWTGPFVPLDSIGDDEWRRIRAGMVSSPNVVGRRCYDGDLSACRLALRLEEAADAVLDLFDAEGRRRVVLRRSNAEYFQRVSPQEFDSCEAGADFSCITLMRQLSPNLLPMPGANANVLLARYAVARGGAGGFERLLDSPGSAIDRIEAASGTTVDSLVAEFQRRMRAAPAPSRDLSASVLFATIGWTLGLGFLSLRSSRWR
jgi:hypothetical protein